MKAGDSLIIILTLIFTVPIIGTMLHTGPVHFMTVTGASMEPTITSSDILVVTSVDTRVLGVGDIISYYHCFEEDPRVFIVTHRIVGLVDGGYRTKGDAYTQADSYTVAPDYVIGIVRFRIPYLGELVHFAGTSRGVFMLLILPATVVIILEIRNIIR